MNTLHLSPRGTVKDEQHGESVVGEADNRSSSLSEIEDRGLTERLDSAAFANGSEEEDTEAETERLEESPQKIRSEQNVVLSAAAHTTDEQDGRNNVNTVPNGNTNGALMEVAILPQTSDISSPGDSSDDARLSPTDTSRKRKRMVYTSSPQASVEVAMKDSVYVISQEDLGIREQYPSSSPGAGSDGVQAEQNQGSPQQDEDLSGDAAAADVPRKKSKGKRKVKQADNTLLDPSTALPTDTGVPIDSLGTEAVYGNGEDVAMKDHTEAAAIETNVKCDDGIGKKKTALDALGAIEQCFASLKEKLYDERIARCDAELAMLDSPTPTHPELLAALQVIDRHRDEKIRYEDTLVRYKLQALQRKSVAEKAQAHGQYMCRVQDIREKHLENLNKEFYQIQHERRATKTTAEDYMYHYNPKRSDQIRRQAAYNKEVSLLSGIAKHVGFPAAPEMKGLKQAEIDEDLRAMGITIQPAPVQPAIPKPSLPLSASFSKQKSTTDERFLEQNPWANPHHPAHSHLQRQKSALSRPESPLVTPAPQRRIVDLMDLQGSSSTIADPLSGQNSSMAPTPTTAEERPGAAKWRNSLNAKNNAYSTPGRAPEPVHENMDAPMSGSKEPNTDGPKSSAGPKRPTSSLHRNSSPKVPIHGNNASNPLSIPDGPVSYTNSAIPRFPSVKVEDRQPHSLLRHHIPGPLSVSTGPNGSSRFGGVV